MKFSFLFFTAILFIILFNSCSCFYLYDFNATNNTSGNLKFIFITGSDTTEKTLLPNENQFVYSEPLGGKCSNCQGKNSCLPPPLEDSVFTEFCIIKVYKNDSIVSKTDFNKTKNWKFESEQKVGVYSTTITDSDF